MPRNLDLETLGDFLRAYKTWREEPNRDYWASKEIPAFVDCVWVRPPGEETEFDVSASLWFALRMKGFRVHGQVNMTFRFVCRTRLVLDLVVFDEAGNALAIIEVKKDRKWNKTKYSGTLDQAEKYTMKGVPVYLVSGKAEAHLLVDAFEAAGGPPTKPQLLAAKCGAILHHRTFREPQFAALVHPPLVRPQPKVSSDVETRSAAGCVVPCV